MDPVNIIILLNVIATFGANVTGAKRGLKSTVAEIKEKLLNNSIYKRRILFLKYFGYHN